MKKKEIILCSLIFGVIAIWGFIFFFSDNKIQHYKQLILECQGQIFFHPEDKLPITFPVYFYDEVELSEMANAENFSEVKVFLSNGDVIEASDCIIEDVSDSSYVRGNFYYRRANISFECTEECEIVACSFVYKDTEEKFDLGRIKVRALDPNLSLNRDVFHGRLENVRDDRIVQGEQTNPTINLLELWAEGSESDLKLSKIDLGIDCMSVELSKMKCLNTDEVDFHKVRRMEGFGEDKTTDQISKNNATVLIKKGKRLAYVAPVGVDKSYYEKPMNFYFSPVFYYTDGTGKEVEWACDYTLEVITPVFIEKKTIAQIKKMIEEDGQ